MSNGSSTYVNNFYTLKGLLTNQYDYNAFNDGIYYGMDENGTAILSNPSSLPGHQGHSKNITYIPNQNNFQFNSRVSWDITNPNADPKFIKPNGGLEDFGSNFNHGKSDHNAPDGFMRGGYKANLSRRGIDFQRIKGFLYDSEQGTQFRLRQGVLQLANPQINTRIFNQGVNILASILGAGEIRFRRDGLFPQPAGTSFSIGDTVSDALGGGNLVDTLIGGGNYIGGIIPKEESYIERYGVGDPGGNSSGNAIKDILNDLVPDAVNTFVNPFLDQSYNQPLKQRLNKVDKVNLVEIISAKDGIIDQSLASSTKDFCNFRFEVIDSDNSSNTNYIIFRAFLESIGDNFNAGHNKIKYNGRSESFYTYASFDRTISVKFKIAAQTRYEMKPLYQKINYLAAQTAGNYSSNGRLRTPYMRLTIGDYAKRVPGVLSDVSLNWSREYPWEIALDKETQTVTNEASQEEVTTTTGKDKDQLVLPHVLDVNITFKPIHSFTPQNSPNSPFISIDEWLEDESKLVVSTKENSSLSPADSNTGVKEDGKTKKTDKDKKKENIEKQNKEKNKKNKNTNSNSRNWGYNKLGIPTRNPDLIDEATTQYFNQAGPR